MNADIVKFNQSSGLIGYGFDLPADRVVRFNEHPDGTYLNTRATYYINRKTYTHSYIRTAALQPFPSTAVTKKRKWGWIILIGVILVLVLGKCEMTVSINEHMTTPASQSDITL